MGKQNKPTQIFVGLCLFAALLSLFWKFVPHHHLPYWIIAAVWESWTILNKREADTISETIWELSTRPLVPWLFGALTILGFFMIPDLHVLEIGTWLALQGHFFWQAHRGSN